MNYGFLKRFHSEGVFIFGDSMLLRDLFGFSFSGILQFLTVLFTLAVAFVNGWTDAPNAIASCVVTRCLSLKKAVAMAAVCDFAGAITMGLFSSRVINTVAGLIDFKADGMQALCAAMSSVAVWATAAWVFGIPTSESHALMASLMGAGIAADGGFGAVGLTEWRKVFWGLFLSVFLGFFSGFIISKITVYAFKSREKEDCDIIFKSSQITASALMSFMHGAQDSQKFAGILLIAFSLSGFGNASDTISFPTLIISSLAIALGTATGGSRIIKTVGMDMIKLRRDQGFSADAAGAFCLFVSTAFGLPVSTTHIKTSAILGVGASKSIKSVNWSVACEMAAAWLLTFPGCVLLGYLMTQIYMRLF